MTDVKTSDNKSIEINIKEPTKINNPELSTLKHSIGDEKDEIENETISQSEDMIQKQRQITNFSDTNIEMPKTNNNIKTTYVYHKLGNCHAFFGNKSGDPLFIIGPQWPMFITLTLIVNITFYLLLYY